MSYPVLTALVVGIAAVAAVVLASVARARGHAWRDLLLPPAVAVAVLLVLTAVFDNVIISVGLVAYDPARTSGIVIGLAPIEDFAYPLVGALLLPLIHTLLRGALPAGDAAGDAVSEGGA